MLGTLLYSYFLCSYPASPFSVPFPPFFLVSALISLSSSHSSISCYFVLSLRFSCLLYIFPYILSGGLVTKLCLPFCDPTDCSLPGSLVHPFFSRQEYCSRFSRQEYWSRSPSQGDLPHPGIKPVSPAFQVDSLPTEPPGKPICHLLHRYHLPTFSSCIFLGPRSCSQWGFEQVV